MQKAIPLGISDYRKLKENEYYAVDKSMMIHEFLQRNHKVTFITRPRNFGKTLNMSMMAEFFDITKDSRFIFRNTAIMNTEYANQINSYPVIYLTFANARLDLFQVKTYIRNRVMEEYLRYQDV